MPFWVPGSFHPMLQAKCCNQFVGPISTQGNNNNQRWRSFFTSDLLLELSEKSWVLYSPCLRASFHLLSPLSVVSAKPWIFIKSQYEMLKLSIQCTETNHHRCTGRSSENIGSSSGGAQAKGKTGWNSVYHQIWWFFILVSPSLNPNVFFSGL